MKSREVLWADSRYHCQGAGSGVRGCLARYFNEDIISNFSSITSVAFLGANSRIVMKTCIYKKNRERGLEGIPGSRRIAGNYYYNLLT